MSANHRELSPGVDIFPTLSGPAPDTDTGS
jgi:hypothetical protein